MNRIMHRISLLGKSLILLVFAGGAAMGGPGAHAQTIPEFEAAYKVRASVASGELSMSLTAGDDGVYLFKTLTRPRGLVKILARGEIAEQTHIVFDDHAVVPLDYTLRDTISKNHDAELSYDWDEGTVAGTERGEDVAAGLEPGMLNRAALYLALMQDLGNDGLPESYTLFDRGQVKTFAIENSGREVVDVPFGKFEAVKLVRKSEGSSRSMLLWCAPELNFLPVRIDLIKGDKRISRAELKALTGLPGKEQAPEPDPAG